MSKTLTASGWSGSSAPYSQTISVGTEYTDPRIFEIVPNPSNTDTQNKAYTSIGGGVCSLSNGNLTLKIYGKKPSIDIPIQIIVRGDM